MEHVFDYSADIAFISETWLKQDCHVVKAQLSAVGYSLYHKPRCHDTKGRGGGVAIICRTHHKINVEYANKNYKTFEQCCYSMKLPKCHKLLLVSLYRPCDSSVSCFMEEFSEFLSELSTLNAHVIIAGDVNIHCNITNSTARKFNDLLTSFNLRQYHIVQSAL